MNSKLISPFSYLDEVCVCKNDCGIQSYGENRIDLDQRSDQRNEKAPQKDHNSEKIIAAVEMEEVEPEWLANIIRECVGGITTNSYSTNNERKSRGGGGVILIRFSLVGDDQVREKENNSQRVNQQRDYFSGNWNRVASLVRISR